MATTRFGHLDDFTLKNSKVGIGTSDPTESLEVIGGARGGSVDVTGIATLTSYSGFQNKNFEGSGNITGGESGTLSGEVVVGTGFTMSVGTGATTGQGSIKSLKVSNTFTPPIGLTADRPTAPQPGALYYNKDFRTIEFWDGSFWRQVDNRTPSGRMVIGGGRHAPAAEVVYMHSIEIPTLGHSVYFGDLTVKRDYPAGCSSEIRGLCMGGDDGPAATNVIDYFALASKSNAVDFGNLNNASLGGSACSSSTRGIFAGGQSPTVLNVIDYVEISTKGNAIDFGDLINTSRYNHGCSSPTRGIFAGGLNPSRHNYTEYITIASKGNSVKFGNIDTSIQLNSVSNNVRGVIGGGYTPSITSKLDYIIMASTGNGVYFGDLTVARGFMCSSGNQTRGIFAAGNSPTYHDIIDYITINSGGNAVDFGDCEEDFTTGFGCSDSHGGLGGF